MTDLAALLRKHRACSDAQAWAANYTTLAEAWAACDRADWMLWLAGRLSGPSESDSRKRLVLCTCACARTALPFVREGETRPLAAIETDERWARGESGVALADVRAAAAADADAAASAASAAAYAADAAASAAYAAADEAANAASAAVAWHAARAQTLKQLADLVREHYPTPPEVA